MIKITLDRKTLKEKFIDGWEDANDITEQKFINEFAKMFINVNNKQKEEKPIKVKMAI